MDVRMELEVHAVNEAFLWMLLEMARHDARPMIPLLQTLRAPLLGLDAEAVRRAAARTWLLPDFKFRDIGW